MVRPALSPEKFALPAVFLLFTFFQLSQHHPCLAAFPTGLTYQGSLKQNGVAYNGTQNMTFKIYDALTGGGLKWSASQAVLITEGLYKVELTPANVDWGNGDYFLETCINGNCLAPREKLTSAASALVAKDLAGNATVNGNLKINGNLSIGDSSGSYALNITQEVPQLGLRTTSGRYYANYFATSDTGGFDIRSVGSLYPGTRNGRGLAKSLWLGIAPSDNGIIMDVPKTSGGYYSFGIANQERFGIQDSNISMNGNVNVTGSLTGPTNFIFNVNQKTAARMYDDGNVKYFMSYNNFLPADDNVQHLGWYGWHWADVYAANGVIQTSASRKKKNIRELNFDGGSVHLVNTGTSLASPPIFKRVATKGGVEVIESVPGKQQVYDVPRGIMFKWKNSTNTKIMDADFISFNGDDLPVEAHAMRDDGTRDPDNFYTGAVVGILCAKVRTQDAAIKQQGAVIKDLTSRIALLEKKVK